ncbi:MAG: T9SS type A sorting domain-containing protein [Candidatus Cloacimonetes bacterium]|nr:T9SS type A sorting domain-containing protein [Candidatus Cloacimonadota bacterium]
MNSLYFWPLITFQGLEITGGKGTYNAGEGATWGYRGGGFFIESREAGGHGQNVKIDWCKINDNSATWGGGIFLRWGCLELSNSEVVNNYLSYSEDDIAGFFPYTPRGGGVYAHGARLTVQDTKFYNNRSFEDLSSVLNWGNAPALWYEYDCLGNPPPKCEVRSSQFYNNVSILHDCYEYYDPIQGLLSEVPDIHSSAIVAQFTTHNVNHEVIFVNNTITDNTTFKDPSSTFERYTSLGLNHYRTGFGELKNNIVWNSRSGSANNLAVVPRQIMGTYHPDGNPLNGTLMAPVFVTYSDMNNAENHNYYAAPDGPFQFDLQNIDMDPIFEDPVDYDYNLRWDISAISPCIDRGDPSNLDEIDDTPSDMGAKTYPIAHEYERYTMPILNNVKWMCYPVLNDITDDSCVNETFFSPIINLSILDYVMYKPHLSSTIHTMEFSNGVLQFGSEVVQSAQGYKVKLQNNYSSTINIPTPGTLIPPETVVNLHNMAMYGTNWVGYFVRESAKPLDALASVLDHLTKIETAKWSMVKQANGSWIHGKSFILNHGDLVILHSEHDCSFVWNNPHPVQPVTLGTPTAFNYTEKPSYTPFYISLPDAKDGELPSEIGLYVNDVCKGAVVVEDSLLHICAYLDNGEVITPENSYLVFFYPAKSAPNSKSIYRMSVKQFQQIKSPSTYYLVSITDPQNCSSVSPIVTMRQNYPNPFNPSTTISYELPEDGNVQILIYNLKGQFVKQLLNKQESIGPHAIIWDGKDSTGRACSSGIYYYRLSSPGKIITKKMLMLK